MCVCKPTAYKCMYVRTYNISMLISTNTYYYKMALNTDKTKNRDTRSLISKRILLDNLMNIYKGLGRRGVREGVARGEGRQ